MPDDKANENNKPDDGKSGIAVPFSRISRLAKFGGMAANVAGGMFFDGVQQLVSGKRPSIDELLMTPANAVKVTNQLANMRGAAMKLGQMLSMDSGDFLPRELADILATLRSDAKNMPEEQLRIVLKSQWGPDWESRFSVFHIAPIAAASIGQVHRAITRDGHDLAIKVQYPGVKNSIDSDISNVSALLRMTGILPAKLDIKPLLAEASKQLHEEADYEREASYLLRFRELLSGDTDFRVPSLYAPLSTGKILAMSYEKSVPIEAMMDAPQHVRDRIAYLLISLLLRELFEFGMMQTDPNFANYRYDNSANQLVLLDFGASRDIDDTIRAAYRNIMCAVLNGDEQDSFDAATDIGFIDPDMPEKYKADIMDMLAMVMEPLQEDRPFDFGDNDIAMKLRDKGMDLAMDRELWHLPPPETIFIQRKFSGVYMLATRLRAKVNVRALMTKYTAMTL